MPEVYQPLSKTIKQMMTMFSNGELQVPEIQRDVVWDIDRVKEFIDTIYLGYPCGSFVWWKPPQKNKDVLDLVKPERIQNSVLPDYLIIDGQQRLTALVHALLGPDYLKKIAPELYDEYLLENETPPHILIDVKKLPKMFLVASTEADPSEKGIRVPLHALCDDVSYDRIKEVYSLTPDQKRKISDFRNTLLSYPVSVQEITEKVKYAEVSEIFTRINTMGVPLTGAEIHIAQIVPYWRGITSKIRAFRKELWYQERVTIDLSVIMKCLSTMLTNNHEPNVKKLTSRIISKDIDKNLLDRNWAKLIKSFKELIKVFHKNDISSTRFCTTSNLFVPLFHYINICGGKINEKQVVKFYFLAQLGYHYSQQSDRVLKRDIEKISSESNFTNGIIELNKILESEARAYHGKLKINESWFRESPSKNPLIVLLYSILVKNQATDFQPDVPLKLADIEVNDLHLHHIFPRAFLHENIKLILNKTGWNPLEFHSRVNSIANITIISQKANSSIGKENPTKYFAELSQSNLKAHIIPSDKRMWAVDNFHLFLAAREKMLSFKTTSLLKTFVSY